MAAKISLEQKAAWFADIIKLMEGGVSFRSSCRVVGCTPTQMHDYIHADADRRERYAAAKAALVECLAEEVMLISDELPAMITDQHGVTRFDNAAVQHQRLRVDTRKWILAKIAPKQYGERVEVAGDNAAPLSVIIRGDDAKL